MLPRGCAQPMPLSFLDACSRTPQCSLKLSHLPPRDPPKQSPSVQLNCAPPVPPRQLSTIRVFAWLYTSMMALFLVIAFVCDLHDGGWSNVRLFVNPIELWVAAGPFVLVISFLVALVVNLVRHRS